MKAVTSLRPCCSSLINHGGGGPTKPLANLSCRRLRMWKYHTHTHTTKTKNNNTQIKMISVVVPDMLVISKSIDVPAL